jgi:uncharacterized protein DUF6496
MAKQSKEQKETVERVMHEFKHGELETGTGKKVRNPKQAIAIGLREAGASKYESEEENRENLKRTKEREHRGQTAQDEEEGGGQGRSSGSSGHAAGSEKSKAELYEKAKEKDIPGRSKMSKDQLARALHKHDS